jgi:nucleotide-binding universal stress UspA family protein
MTHSAPRSVLAATDFSAASAAALGQAAWVAERVPCPLVLAHVLRDMRAALAAMPYAARWELVAGDAESAARELRRDANQRLDALGEPFVELIHAVQQEGHELLVTGTRGQGGAKRWLLGSTAQRLVRKCPAAVWVVPADRPAVPGAVLAAVDFSDVSRRALAQAAWLAGLAGAALHVLHVVSAADVPAAEGEPAPPSRRVVRNAAASHLEQFLGAELPGVAAEPHLATGEPAQAVAALVKRLSIDLVVIGTVGRSGIAGVLLGSTAEKVLTRVECGVLTVKPAGFVCPIAPPVWPLHPPDAAGS